MRSGGLIPFTYRHRRNTSLFCFNDLHENEISKKFFGIWQKKSMFRELTKILHKFLIKKIQGQFCENTKYKNDNFRSHPSLESFN